jgi:hypothetical protein
MIRHWRRAVPRLAVFVATLTGAVVAPGVAASAPTQEGTLEIVGGTYNDADLGIIGTTFLFNPVVAEGVLGSVEITGPSGWNDGNAVACVTWQPPGGDETRSPCWFFVLPVSGTYHGTAMIEGQLHEADFEIDASKKLPHPSITAVRLRTHRVKIAWEAARRARAFIVRINDKPPSGFQVDRVASGDSDSIRLSGFTIESGTDYQVVVFAASRDIATPRSLGTAFNMSSTDSIVGLGA